MMMMNQSFIHSEIFFCVFLQNESQRENRFCFSSVSLFFTVNSVLREGLQEKGKKKNGINILIDVFCVFFCVLCSV